MQEAYDLLIYLSLTLSYVFLFVMDLFKLPILLFFIYPLERVVLAGKSRNYICMILQVEEEN